MTSTDGRFEVYFSEEVLARVHEDVVLQTLYSVRAKFRARGIDSDGIRIGGSRCILVPLADLERMKQNPGLQIEFSRINFQKIDETIDPTSDEIPPGYELLGWSRHFYDPRPGPIVVRKRVVISGGNIVDAQATMEGGQPVVTLRFDIFTQGRKSARVLEDDDVIAVVLDDDVITTLLGRDLRLEHAVIRSAITRTQAEELAEVLRPVKFPAPIKEVDACPTS